KPDTSIRSNSFTFIHSTVHVPIFVTSHLPTI
ncbi:unnamed protein product, partial [Allacma fusca]